MTTHAGENAESLQPDDPRELGPYRLLARLGRGGMGTVFLGRAAAEGAAEGAAGRRVAVKMINRELAGEGAFRERFRREVTAARQVRRFCTAPVIDAELDRDPLYVVTEFIEGPSLERAVAERGPLPGSDLEGLAVGVATALAAIHGAGIVHRDLKPANVLLSATGPRVIDFGIARALDVADGPTRTGQFVGTPNYLPPELLRGEPVTPASDIFSWGCVVAYAGTGRAPFAGRTVPEIFYRVAHDPPVLDGLDDDLRGLVERALDKDPRNRPSTQEVLARLIGHERTDPAQAAETVEATWQGPAPGTRADFGAPPPPIGPPPGPPAGPPHGPPAGPPPGPPHGLPPGPPGQPLAGQPPTPVAGAGRQRGARAGLLATGRRRLLVALGAVLALAVAAGVVVFVLTRTGVVGSSPPAAGKTLRQLDNFENTGSGWPNGPNDCGRYDKGSFLIVVKGFSDRTVCDAPGGVTSSTNRYLTDLKVRLNGGPPSGQWDAGVFFLRENRKGYDVVLRPDGTARIRKVTEDRGVDVAKATVNDYDKAGFNRIQAVLDVSTPAVRIEVWINGKRAFEYTDNEPVRSGPNVEGKSGIIVNRPQQGADSTEATASFDDYGEFEAGK